MEVILGRARRSGSMALWSPNEAPSEGAELAAGVRWRKRLRHARGGTTEFAAGAVFPAGACLIRTSLKEPRDANVFVEVIPVESSASCAQLGPVSVRACGVQKPREESKGNAEKAPVYELDPELLFIAPRPCGDRGSYRNAHSSASESPLRTVSPLR